jgi:acyl-CoA thioester hydrolase
MSLISIPIRVYYEDTDLGSVVYYANYLKFFERARTEWLRGIGISNLTMLQNEGTAFVVTECNVKYYSPAKMDDLLQVSVDNYTPQRASAKLEQSVMRAHQILCKATIAMACIDVSTGAPVRLPKPIAKASISRNY